MRGSLLQERCELEFERYVAGIHASKFDDLGMACVSVPWARSGWGITKAGIPHVIGDIQAALDARIWFSVHGPDWAQELPLGDECYPMMEASGLLHLLGRYGFSLWLLDFDYLTHPQIYEFSCGLMASPQTPEHVREDPELLAEFPARELPGLCGRLVWFGENLPRLTGA